MEDTGERFIPNKSSLETALEHWHRYLFVKAFVKDKVVLDIASGEGFGSYYLSSVAKKVIGVDINSEAISHSEKKYARNNLSFIHGNAREIPLQEPVDVIVSFETLEHLSEDDQKKFLEETQRLLKKDGALFMSTPNKKVYSDPEYEEKNEYHLKEFYEDEFLKFLSNYFPSNTLFGQHIYLQSNIWELGETPKAYEEHYISFEKQEAVIDASVKAPRYFITCSSYQPFPSLPTNSLIDTDPSLVALYKNRARENEKLKNTIRAHENSLSWKLTAPLRKLKALFNSV